jgi:tRNA A-37 threonylcarbamoyl transferase component Bud32
VAAKTVTPTLRVGEVVAEKYRLEHLLGSGGMAEVYAALNVRTDKRVAIKWIHPAMATEEARTRFGREALAAGRIHHPNVVTIFDVVEHQGSTCLVMELLEGETLAKRMSRTKQLPVAEAVALIWPAMRGVAAAHAQGVIHRDLKPDNIFICLDPHGVVRDCKVLDFGVSKLAADDSGTRIDITLAGNLVGTPAYMAPEQVRGSREVDQRADVFALGVVFFEMLAGRLPFVNELYSAMMVDIATSNAPSVTRFRPDVPRRIAQVVHRALERNVERRFQDIPSFMHALEEAARDELLLPAGTPPESLLTQIAMPRPTPSAPRRPTLSGIFRLGRERWAQIFAVVVLATVALTVWLWRGAGRRAPAPSVATTPPAAQTIRPAPPPMQVTPAVPSAPDSVPPVGATVPATPAVVPAASAAPIAAPARPRSTKAAAPGDHGRNERAAGENQPAPAAPETQVDRPPRQAPAPPARPPRAGKLSVDEF